MRTHARFAAAVLLLAATTVHAQPYPSKSLRIIVPFPLGGNIDITGGTLAPGLTETLGQPVIVDNRGGAGGAPRTR